MKKIVPTVLLSAGVTTMLIGDALGKSKKLTVEDYVEKFKGIAITEMNRSGVPASITLAQGILESRSGNSYLSRTANNHFGIKCHRSWKGKRKYANDDKPGECFRNYPSANSSFVDHTDFLLKNKRYSFLFKNNKVDYNTWANGLRKAGYATDKQYAKKLIKLIERYDLSRFDIHASKLATGGDRMISVESQYNGVKTVTFNQEIKPEKISTQYGVPVDKLLEYNNLKSCTGIPANTMIFLEHPARKRSWVKQQDARKPLVSAHVKQLASQYGINSKQYQKDIRKHYEEVKSKKGTSMIAELPQEGLIHEEVSERPSVVSPLLKVTPTKVEKSQSQVKYCNAPKLKEGSILLAKTEAQKTPEVRPLVINRAKTWTLSAATVESNSSKTPPPKTGLLKDADEAEKKARKVGRTHIVRRGDTLFGLARKHKTTIRSLKFINNLHSDRIYVGQRLRLFV